MTNPGELLNHEEDLLPEFAEWVTHVETLGTCIQHPLYYSIMHHPSMNAIANATLKQKQRMVREALSDKRWLSYIMLHERPWRFEALTEIADEIDSADEYWTCVQFVWTDSENIWQHHDQWLGLFGSRPGAWRMMSAEEQSKLKHLPPTFRVFRGTAHSDRIEGLSWTLYRDQAVWFAERFDAETPLLVEGIATRDRVIALFTGRDEEEIVINPRHVSMQQVVNLYTNRLVSGKTYGDSDG